MKGLSRFPRLREVEDRKLGWGKCPIKNDLLKKARGRSAILLDSRCERIFRCSGRFSGGRAGEWPGKLRGVCCRRGSWGPIHRFEADYGPLAARQNPAVPAPPTPGEGPGPTHR